MKYSVVIHKRAYKYLLKQPKNIKKSIINSLKLLSNGEIKSLSVKDMFGEWYGYKRFRVGKIRVIFSISEDEKTIYVDYIGARGDIYKK